ncbi:glycosyltransferase [Neokomagataea tanensis]|uniref:glycosyltransferase n=1 Tax=Neokomagataea TaxID=1223423 RepID=UPI001476B14B|nr:MULTISPECIES: glycosyltransferase [Neokomagataea]
MNERNQMRGDLERFTKSRSWKITAPLRLILSLKRGYLPNGKTIKEYINHFVGLDFQQKKSIFIQKFNKQKNIIDVISDNKKDLYKDKVYINNIRPKFLIIAELTIQQCAKYRVWQKKDLLERLGWSVQVVDWRDNGKVLSELQFCTQVIFYRVPGFDSVLDQVKEAHRLQLEPRWEVDDLIFDLEEYRKNGNVAALPKKEQDVIFFGVDLFRKCMLACGRGLASTKSLAQAMKDAGLPDVGTVENALDLDTMSIVEKFPPGFDKEETDQVWICYGSGTNTHDADFLQAEGGLWAAMLQEEKLCLRVIGPVKVPEKFDRFGDRVERLPMRPYAQYLEILSQSDISIAPLQETLFNNCKSNIKYVEASIVGVSSICSPMEPFSSIIKNGNNGFIATSPEEWCEYFLRLGRDVTLRRSLAQQAMKDVLQRYHPDQVAVQQVFPLYGRPKSVEPEGLRVLSVNVYYKPFSFGGATIVAEELVDGLKQRGVDISVASTRPDVRGRPNGALRYVADGVKVLGLSAPEASDRYGWMDNPSTIPEFTAWLEAVEPNIVHFHSIQGMGLSLLRCCEEHKIPYVITLHDAWWLCERQFMVKADGQYCFQKTISFDVCRNCHSDVVYLDDRQKLMFHALKKAALLLAPSETQRQLYIANGILPEQIVVNKNGFTWPKRPKKKRAAGERVRFAYVGGTEEIKGFSLLKKASEKIENSDWSLTLVDNKLNLGYRSIYEKDWTITGNLHVRPGYSQSELDAFYDDVDVLLFPSQWKESYGLTVREALARDVWVITTAPGGQAEDVVDGVNGTHLPIDGRPDALYEAMKELIEDPGRFANYVNPLKAQLCTFERQSDELLEYLKKYSVLEHEVT